ncbi:MAG: DUF4364 family protein [Clostridia bacterium]|nr:DUF4364 family protein [Clostridia bacterium]
MASNIGSMNNVKIFVLYLMHNIGYPLDFVTVNDIVMQTDYIMYLDFAVAFHEMLDGGLIAEAGKDKDGETTLYEVTHKGMVVAEQLRCDLLPSILDKSLTCALRYLDLKRRGVVVDCTSQKLADQTFDVTFTIQEKKKTILTATLNVDSEYRSRQMRESFRDRPDVIYRGIIALLTGQVDHLMDKN